MSYLPADKRIGLIESDRLPLRHEYLEAVQKIAYTLREKPKSIITELNVYRKFCPVLIKALLAQSTVLDASIREKDQALKGSAENINKRWTKEEDNVLIEQACKPGQNIQTLSITFGRTPASVAGRISHLVGVKRLSQEIAGRFVGYINGEKTEADIAGTLHKEEQK